MKNKILYISLCILFISSVGFIVMKYKHTELKKEATVYDLLPRKGMLTKTDEWINTQKNVAILQKKIKEISKERKRHTKDIR